MFWRVYWKPRASIFVLFRKNREITTCHRNHKNCWFFSFSKKQPYNEVILGLPVWQTAIFCVIAFSWELLKTFARSYYCTTVCRKARATENLTCYKCSELVCKRAKISAFNRFWMWRCISYCVTLLSVSGGIAWFSYLWVSSVRCTGCCSAIDIDWIRTS